MTMKRLRLVCLLAMPALAEAVLPRFEITSESPVFNVLQSNDSLGNQSFPLQKTDVDASVANGVAHVRVSQRYTNQGLGCLQLRYIFPLPSRAAISAMWMIVGNRTVEGQIRTRSDARQEFEEARESGQTASLLDQERPNVFAMELANIVPGDAVQVIVEYEETLVPIDGIFAFTFPTVVGPRYGQGWQSGASTSDLSVDLRLTVAPMCLGMESVHQTQIHNTSNTTSAVLSGMNSDLIIHFWFTEAAVGAQLLVTESYFSLAIQPPQRQLLSPSQISKREYIFVLDVSGSMTGYPIDLSRSLMTQLLRDYVRAGDRLNILLFAGGSNVLSPQGSLEATEVNVKYAETWLDENMRAGGGTELLFALNQSFSLPQDPSTSRIMIIMTDGYVTVEKEAFDIVRANIGKGNVFVFGVGSSVNRYLLEGLARVGYGEPFMVRDETEGPEVVTRLRLYVDTPVLTDLQLTFPAAFEASDQEPPNLPDVLASRPIQVVGKWAGALTGSVEVRGRLAGGETWSFAVDLGALNAVEVPAVRLLWARSRIAVLSDYAAVAQSHDAHESEITRLGLQYSLMTTHTSFVAVDSQASRPDMCSVITPDTPEVDSEYGYGYGYGGYGNGGPPPSRALHSEPPLVMMLAALLFGPGWL